MLIEYCAIDRPGLDEARIYRTPTGQLLVEVDFAGRSVLDLARAIDERIKEDYEFGEFHPVHDGVVTAERVMHGAVQIYEEAWLL